MLALLFCAIIPIKRGAIVEEELYQSAIESRKRYREEELTDFDDFMNEIEKEYSKGQE